MPSIRQDGRLGVPAYIHRKYADSPAKTVAFSGFATISIIPKMCNILDQSVKIITDHKKQLKAEEPLQNISA